jgi:two-component system response regulator AtoC
MAKVLVVDDEATMVQMVTEMLRAEGHEVSPFTNANSALEALESSAPELVITDLYLEKNRPGGLEVLQRARALNPPALVIVVTAFGSIDTAVEAMKKGAYDYLEKPFNLDELRLCVRRALSYSDALSENLFLRKQLKTKYQLSQIVGTSVKMQEVFKMIERVADTDSTILILGESGTGKELVARALHFNSRRQFAPFVPIDCSALPESLLESELFGHRRGAFTGAINDKKGLFQEAEGGTIFLDEVASMSPMLQSRLLRVLQEREVRRVGDNVPIYVNVRVLAATNEPLEKKIKENSFREDLYYRLNVISIPLSPLRERRDDIPLLVAHFLKNKISSQTGKTYRVTRQVMAVLSAHDWPGNVRELENAIERACTLCEGNVLQLADLPPALHHYASQVAADIEIDPRIGGEPPAAGATAKAPPSDSRTEVARPSAAPPATTPGSVESLKNYLRQQEVSHINRALASAGGDKEKAATLLGISLATLYRKLVEGEGNQ